MLLFLWEKPKLLTFNPSSKSFSCSPLPLLQCHLRDCLKKYKPILLLSVICILLIPFSLKQNEMERNRNLTAVSRLQPAQPPEAEPSHAGAEPPKKDAFTSTEGYEELQNKRSLEEDRYHRLPEEAELRSRPLSRRDDEDLDVPSRRRRGFASQSGIPIRKHHRLDEGYDFGRRFYRMDYGPELGEEVEPRLRWGSAYDRRTHADRYSALCALRSCGAC